MPGYVGRLFDYALKHPEIYRLVTWAALERPATDPMAPRRLAQFRRAAVEAASRMLSPTGP